MDKLSVLIVDDEVNMLSLLERYLHDFKVYTSQSLESAQQKIQTHSLDLIITDVQLEGYSGIQLLKMLSGSRTSIPVILMSGYDVETMPATALMKGAYCFLEKPFSQNELLSSIDMALRRRRKTA